jgi:serine/threonine protein kinase
LSDFGLAGFVDQFAGQEKNTTTLAGSLRWQAPELLCMEEEDLDGSKTLASDIWAFACTVFEVCTLKFSWRSSDSEERTQLLDDNLPYHWYNYDYGIMKAIYKNQRPVRDRDKRSSLSKDLSERFLGTCWSHKALERPGIEEVVEKLQSIDILQYQ